MYREEMHHSSTVGRAVFLIVAGLRMAFEAANGGLTWPGFLIGILEGIAGYGVAYLAVYLLTAFIPWVMDIWSYQRAIVENETRTEEEPIPAPPAAPDAGSNGDAVTPDPYEYVGVNPRIRVPGKLRPIMRQIAERRAYGDLPEVSPNRLDSLGVASRHGENPEAERAIAFLVRNGFIQGQGERRPYTWTNHGKRAFPADGPPPLTH